MHGPPATEDLRGVCDRAREAVEAARRDDTPLDADALRRRFPGLPEDVAEDLLTLPPPPTPLAGPSRFRRIGRLPGGRGGMGEISLATDTQLNRTVAVKSIVPARADDPSYRAKFRAEAEVTGHLQHPGVVPVYALEEDAEGRPFYAMRLVEGGTLEEAVAEFHAGGRPDFRSVAFGRLLDRFADVCQTVAYAHSRGVLHRDLKPNNVLVGDFGETLVIDWGLARVREAEAAADESPVSVSRAAATLSGRTLGTFGFAAPEQMEGDADRVGPRSDVYSLGAILYTLLTGRPPMEATQSDYGVDELVRRTREGHIEPPRELSRAVPRPLAAVCMKALAGEPDGRYADAPSLLEDVQRWRADEPVAARREGVLERTTRLTRRHRTAAAAAVVALAAVTAVGGVALVRVNAARLGESEAKAEAVAAADRASELADRRRRSLDVFLGAFAAPRLENEGATGDMTAAEVLERAADQVAEELSDEDPAKVELLRAIADSFFSVGRYDRAAELSEAALELHRRTSKDRVAESDLFGGHVAALLKAGRFAESVPLAAEAKALAEEVLVEDDPERLVAAERHGWALYGVGEVDRSYDVFEEAHRRAVETFGPDHERTLTTQDAVASLLMYRGRPAEAVDAFRDVHAARRDALGEDHPETLTSAKGLAHALAVSGRLDEAIELGTQTVRLKRAKLGDAHADTAEELNNLGFFHLNAGDPGRAVELLRESAESYEAALGPDHPATLLTTANLGYAMHQAGDAAAAEDVQRDVLARMEAELGPWHPHTLESRSYLAALALDAGDAAAAARLEQDVLVGCVAAFGWDHGKTAVAINYAADAYERAGRETDALALRQDAVRRLDAAGRPLDNTDLHALNNLGRLLFSMRRPAEAEPILDRAVRRRRELLPADHPDLLVTMRELALVLLTLGRADAAAELIEEVAAGHVASGSEHAESARMELASVLTHAGRPEDALPLIEAGLSETGNPAGWLIKRALAQRATGDPAGAAADAEAVLSGDPSPLRRLRAAAVLGDEAVLREAVTAVEEEGLPHHRLWLARDAAALIEDAELRDRVLRLTETE